ncbi:MAG: YvcK family protein, partial [Actinobacteria bacterium]|nr:YvcK family protein [Actinomycetota bacterium]
MRSGRVIALSGGVGGAKLALGLAHSLPAEELLVVVNTGDDFEHLGLAICPDIDTLVYTLAGLDNPETGWGRAGDTGACMAALAALGGETWFFLGDGDLAMHLERTRRLGAGERLSEVTADLARRLGVGALIAPMSDDTVRTMVRTTAGELSFQHYFVRERCRPAVTGFHFAGAERARP